MHKDAEITLVVLGIDRVIKAVMTKALQHCKGDFLYGKKNNLKF